MCICCIVGKNTEYIASDGEKIIAQFNLHLIPEKGVIPRKTGLDNFRS